MGSDQRGWPLRAIWRNGSRDGAMLALAAVGSGEAWTATWMLLCLVRMISSGEGAPHDAKRKGDQSKCEEEIT